MRNMFWPVVLLIAVSGCATTTQATRSAQFLSSDFNNQVQKKISVLPLIDARSDKDKDMQKLLSNKGTRDLFVSQVLRARGYAPVWIDADIGKCDEKAETLSILNCFDGSIFQNGDIFLLISIDEYVPPDGMRVAGNAKLSGVIYSKESNDFIWKDSIGGNYGGVPGAYGIGAYTGMLLVKAMSKDALFRNNVYNAATKLLDSVPAFTKK